MFQGFLLSSDHSKCRRRASVPWVRIPPHPLIVIEKPAKIADYVICNKEMYVLAVVELDDRTHRNDKDAKRDAMLVQAGYKVIRWDSKNKPTAEQIRERF